MVHFENEDGSYCRVFNMDELIELGWEMIACQGHNE